MLNCLDVYIIIDDPVVGKFLQRLLETGSLRCHCFTAVTTLLEHMSELVDGCILLDDAASDIDCLELLARIRQVKGAFPVILMTAQPDVGFAAKAIKAGVASLIVKPCSNDALFAAIHSALLGKSTMAVLAVIRNEANKAGECFLSVAQIAERAKVGRTKTRAAIRLAESYGVVTIKEAPGRRRVIVNRRIEAREASGSEAARVAAASQPKPDLKPV